MPTPNTTPAIPPQHASQLRLVAPLDTRSDDEIWSSLSHHQPVPPHSERNIWAFWDRGLATIPTWCRRNIIGWIRLNGPSWTVRILDSVPISPNHALCYLDRSLLADAFVNDTMEGCWVGPHSADLLRGAALWSYGGVWVDVGVLMVRKLEDVFWKQLQREEGPFRVSIPWVYGQMTFNFIVAARKGDPFIERW